MMLLFLKNHVPNIVFGCQKQPSQQHLGVALPAALLDPWLSCSVCTCHPELPKHMDSWYPTKLRWIIKNSEINCLILQCFWLTGQSNSKLAHEIHQQRKTRPKIIYLSDEREKNVSAPRCWSPNSGIENPGSYHLWKCLSLLRKIFTSVLLYIKWYLHQPSFEDNKLTNFDHENRYHIV